MKVYELDKDGNFLTEYECQPCPVTGGFLYPTYYAETPPPAGEFESVKFVSGFWVTEKVKTLKEKIEAGIIKLSNNEKYDNGIIRQKTIDELLSDKLITKDEWYKIKLTECLNNRKYAYQSESDPLKNELEYDGKDLKIWRDKIVEIKLRYPKPEIV